MTVYKLHVTIVAIEFMSRNECLGVIETGEAPFAAGKQYG